jgi:15-cis-phytoene synthase
MLPPARRKAIVAVWDFCRAVDDAVDEVGSGTGEELTGDAREKAEADLRMWRDEIEQCFAQGVPRTAQGRALQPVIQAFHLGKRPFEDLLDGVEMDLRRDRYETFDELREYCRRVASAVGLICIEVFGCRSAAAREYAVDLGLALQLTNIVRDVAGDLVRGRVYLPQEDLRRYGVSRADLEQGRMTPSMRALLAFECARARDYFDRAARALPAEEARKLLAAEIMGAIYFEILERIERRGFDVFSTKVRVPRPYRAWLALSTGARMLTIGHPSARRLRSRADRTERGAG